MDNDFKTTLKGKVDNISVHCVHISSMLSLYNAGLLLAGDAVKGEEFSQGLVFLSADQPVSAQQEGRNGGYAVKARILPVFVHPLPIGAVQDDLFRLFRGEAGFSRQFQQYRKFGKIITLLEIGGKGGPVKFLSPALNAS